MEIGNLLVMVKPSYSSFKKIEKRLILFFLMNGMMQNLGNKHQDRAFDNIGMNRLKGDCNSYFLKMLQSSFILVVGSNFQNSQRLEVGYFLTALFRRESIAHK